MLGAHKRPGGQWAGGQVKGRPRWVEAEHCSGCGHQLSGRTAAVQLSEVLCLWRRPWGQEAGHGGDSGLPAASSEPRWEEDASSLDGFGEMEKRDVSVGSDSAWVLGVGYSALGPSTPLAGCMKAEVGTRPGASSPRMGSGGNPVVFLPKLLQGSPRGRCGNPQAVQNRSALPTSPPPPHHGLPPSPSGQAQGHSWGEG